MGTTRHGRNAIILAKHPIPLHCLAMLGLLVWNLGSAANAQGAGCPMVTGEDATVIVPASAIGLDVPLAAGDVLRAYDSDGECIGEVVWPESGNAALTLWGDDVTTLPEEGATIGEEFSLRMVRGQEELPLWMAFEDILAAPQGTEAEYYPDAIYLVNGLNASAPSAGEQGLPGEFLLSEAYPNPFTSRASVTLELARTQHVTVTLYDVLGRSVRRIHDGTLQNDSTHRISVEAEGLASGSYLVHLRGEDFAEVRSLTLLGR